MHASDAPYTSSSSVTVGLAPEAIRCWIDLQQDFSEAKCFYQGPHRGFTEDAGRDLSLIEAGEGFFSGKDCGWLRHKLSSGRFSFEGQRIAASE
jgi:hypothetical protein